MERIILPDSTILADYLLARQTWLISGLRVNVDSMRRNIDLTRGLIFSGQLLLDLSAAGMLREDAYRLVQSHAMRSWESEGDFRGAVAGDPIVQKYLTLGDLDRTFSLERQLRHVDVVFDRVFGKTQH